MNITDIQVGQVWRSGDPRHRDRLLLVEAVYETHSRCLCLTTRRRVFIQNDRMTPGTRGHFLVTDPQLLAQLRERYHLPLPALSEAPAAEPSVVEQPADKQGEATRTMMRAFQQIIQAMQTAIQEISGSLGMAKDKS